MLKHEYDTMRRVEDTHWWYQVLRSAVTRDLSENVNKGKSLRLLDGGCGTGGMLVAAREAQPDWKTAGLDFSDVAVEHCRERGFADVVKGSIDEMPFPDASFDVVLSLDVLCHKEVSEQCAASEIARILKPGGSLILNLPAFEALKGRHDIAVHTARRYTVERVRTLLESVNLRTETSFYWNAWLFLPFIAWRHLTRFAKPPEESSTKGDLFDVPPAINAMLGVIGRFDFAVCRTLHPPFGTSVYAVAKKPQGHAVTFI